MDAATIPIATTIIAARPWFRSSRLIVIPTTYPRRVRVLAKLFDEHPELRAVVPMRNGDRPPP